MLGSQVPARAQVLIPRATLLAQATPTRYCWIDVKTGNPVNTSFRLKNNNYEQKPDGSWIDPATGTGVGTSPVGSEMSPDGKTAFNPTTGQNFAREVCPQQAAQTYCWIDVKTGNPVNTSFQLKNNNYEQKPDGSWIDPATGTRVGTSPVGSEVSPDGKTAFNPTTGQNFAREPCPVPATESATPQTTPAPAPTPVLPAAPLKLWNNHFDVLANFDSVHTNGFSGTGTGESFRLTSQWLRNYGGREQPLFTNEFTFERTNASQSVLLGTIIYDENDDEDDCDDYFYYNWGPNDSYGVGIGYEHYHPVYIYGTPYDMQGIGLSLIKFPEYTQPFSFYGELKYSPNISGNGNGGITGSYNVWKYDVGASVNPGWKIPVDFKVGYKYENWTGTGSTSGNSYRLSSPYLGLGYRF